MTEQNKTLTPEQIKSLQEIKIRINFRNIAKAWKWATYTAWFQGYQKAMRGLEGVSRKLMVGKGSVLSMPAGIVLRNTVRAAHNSSEGHYKNSIPFIGGLVALGAVVGATIFGGPLLAAALPSVFAGSIGAAAAYGVTGIGALMALPYPVYTAATLTASTAVALVTGAVSLVIAAPPNALIGWRRTKLASQGYKFTEKDLEAANAEFDRESPTARYEQETFSAVKNGLARLPEDRRREVFDSLKVEFDKAAQKDQAQGVTATASAVPGAKRSRGCTGIG